VQQYLFLDECGVTTDLLRRYGRSPRGTRLRDHTPCGHWQTHTVIAALRADGVTAPAVFDGPIDNASFRAYVEQVLVPSLRCGDVVVLDVRLPDGSGVEACRDIRSRFPEVKVLMLTSFADEEALMSAILAGASGYVLKRVKGTDLVADIRRVGAGESLLDPDMTERLFERLRTGPKEDPLLSNLTNQERLIVNYISDGLTNKQIAEEMYLAEKTVKNYVSNLLAKMGMSRRSEAAAYVARTEAEKEGIGGAESWEEI